MGNIHLDESSFYEEMVRNSKENPVDPENNEEFERPIVKRRYEPPEFTRRSTRMTWQEFQRYLAYWKGLVAQYGPEINAYSSLEPESGIYSVFRNEQHLYIGMMQTPTSRAHGIEKGIEGLRFFHGVPLLAIDQQAAAKLSRKRGGLKPAANWAKMFVKYDYHGALVAKGKEIKFDLEACAKTWAEYQKAKEEQEIRMSENMRAEVIEANSDVIVNQGDVNHAETNPETGRGVDGPELREQPVRGSEDASDQV